MFRVALCASAAVGLWLLWRHKACRKGRPEAPEEPAEALEGLEAGLEAPERPRRTAVVARRLIFSHLGVKLSASGAQNEPDLVCFRAFYRVL